MTITSWRRMPIGAEIIPEGGVHFRVWAPLHRKVDVIIQHGVQNQANEFSRIVELESEQGGYFSGSVEHCCEGALYWFRLSGVEVLHSDPASRFQPEGPDGPSQVIDPAIFDWSDHNWPGISLKGQVLYEMHIGTFTPEGTFAGAARELGNLADLGVTSVELMPVADFMGKFGWGYDGVNLFAPTRLYGGPDDLRRFVDKAHSLGIGVILDVVYNHVGPDGSSLNFFSNNYFTDRHKTDWGKAINYDDDMSGPVREFFCANAGYWIQEYHFDGLRLDATTEIFDSSEDHILTCISQTARKAGGKKNIILIAENESQKVILTKPVEFGGNDLDALWNDDFHHNAITALRGRKEAYYSDYGGTPQEFISSVKWGYLYQGQRYKWQKKRRGSPTFGLRPSAFVNYLDNHDQVANSVWGLRCHQLGSPGVFRALTALLLLSPGTPMLFQGQEFASSKPFLYFADHKPDLARLVYKGRKQFLAQFPSIANREIQNRISDPADPSTFAKCVLDLSERKSNEAICFLHRDLLFLRKNEPVFLAQTADSIDGAVLGPHAFVLRYFGTENRDAIMLVNLGMDLQLDSAPEPLLAPPEHLVWEILWSSEDPRYGGSGTPPIETEDYWFIPGHAAIVLSSNRRKDTEYECLT